MLVILSVDMPYHTHKHVGLLAIVHPFLPDFASRCTFYQLYLTTIIPGHFSVLARFMACIAELNAVCNLLTTVLLLGSPLSKDACAWMYFSWHPALLML